MIKLPSLPLVAACLLTPAVFYPIHACADQDQAPAAANASPAAEDDVLVWVNGDPIDKNIFARYFYDQTRQLPGGEASSKQHSQLLGQLINSLVLTQEATKQGLDKKTAVKAQLELSRWNILTQAAIQEYVAKIKPTDEQLQRLYDEKYSGAPKVEYKARHILLKEEDRKKAESLIAQLNDGADFATLAKDNSTGPTGPSGGDLGWFELGSMVKPFAEALQVMKVDSHSKEPVKTQFGWHIIRLDETREVPHPELDGVREELAVDYQKQALKDYLAGLRNEAKITMNPKLVKKTESK